MAVSKVIYNGNTLIDLTSDTVTEDKLLTGYTAHGADGILIDGACTYDVDSSSATATASDILAGKTAAKNGAILTGTMTNVGAQVSTITEKAEQASITQGYHDGSGYVAISATEQAKIIPSNILSGIQILGVTGTVSPSSDITSQPKTVTPAATEFTVTPDTGYDYLSQVTVEAIPYVETTNASGGTTVTIA